MSTTDEYVAKLRLYHERIEAVLNLIDDMAASGLRTTALATVARQVDNEIKQLVGQAVLR